VVVSSAKYNLIFIYIYIIYIDLLQVPTPKIKEKKIPRAQTTCQKLFEPVLVPKKRTAPSDSLFKCGRGKGVVVVGGKGESGHFRLAFRAREGERVWWWMEEVKTTPLTRFWSEGGGKGVVVD
jgi:hypothetical protein